MLILTSFNKPYIIDDLTSPIPLKHFWGFSGTLFDYKLFPLTYRESTTGPVATIRVNHLTFDVPCSLDPKSSWHVMIADPETHQLDMVPILSIATAPSYAVLMSPEDSYDRLTEIELVDYRANGTVIHPMIPQGGALCHPAGISERGKPVQLAIMITPHDLSKHMDQRITGDLF